ncbi:hypothetical protein H0H93_011120 [Arthromyces matolae]|nr:hypothetical protein H0H93_011120 [Arthromyces matolae]
MNPDTRSNTTSNSLLKEKGFNDEEAIRARELSASELTWSKYYHFLQSQGYTLRRRYHPEWKPSWRYHNRKRFEYEDSVPLLEGHTVDATRADGTLVAVKKVDSRLTHSEVDIGTLFSSPGLLQDSRNHCVPILEVLDPADDSGLSFLVMPLLYSNHLVPFETVGEVINYIRQIFEGLHFMHEHKVAHGNCSDGNIMADAMGLFSSAPHPGRTSMTIDYSGEVYRSASLTTKPIKYYLVGFDNSVNYQDEQEIEGLENQSHRHFAADVYSLGDMLRWRLLDGLKSMGIAPKQGFEFMRELISDMMHDDPGKRPRMEEVIIRFNILVHGLSDRQLRASVVSPSKVGIQGLITHWMKQWSYYSHGIHAIPRL